MDFLLSIKIQLLNMQKLIKIPYFSNFLSDFFNSGFLFCLNCQIPGFFMIQGVMTTLS